MQVRRPLIGIVLCFMLGLGLGRSVPLPMWSLLVASWIVVAGLLCAGLWSPAYKQPIRNTALLIIVVLLGWMRGQPNTVPGIEDLIASDLNGSFTVTGKVAADPLPDRRHHGRACRFPLMVERVMAPGAPPQAASGEIEVLWFGNLSYGDSPAYGERWRFKGRVRPSRGQTRAGRLLMVSDWAKSVRQSRGIMAAMVQFCLAVRHGAAERLREGVADYPASVGMVQALLLGYRSELSREAHRLFVQTGTLHIFAVSGLHVGIVVGMIIFALSAMSVPRRLWVFCVAPLLVGYTLMTGMKPSAVRACIMAIVFLGAGALHRRADSMSALAFAALLLLTIMPGILTEVSFVLSFSVVTGILLLFPFWDRLLHPLWAPDPFKLEREHRGVIVLRGVGKRVAALAAVSVSAWLVSAPLIAIYFGRVAPIALIANIFVVPVAFLIVLSGSLSIFISLFVPFGADLFNHASLSLTHVLMAGLKLLAWIPGGCFEVTRVPWWFPGFWYGAVGVTLLYLYGRQRSC